MLAFKVMLEIARKIGACWTGTATSGTTTTLVDTNMESLLDDFFNGGVLFIQSGNALIQNTSHRISDFTNSTKTITIPTLPYTVAAGNRYTALRPEYNKEDLMAAINQALMDIGPFTQKDESLTVLDDTEEYTLPDGVVDIKRVEIATSDTEPYGFKASHYWKEEQGILRFTQEPPTAGMLIRLYYNANHAEIDADTDQISDEINIERITWAACVHAASARARRTEWDQKAQELIKFCQAKNGEAMIRHPIRKMPKDAVYLW